jgi:hypothetical protein
MNAKEHHEQQQLFRQQASPLQNNYYLDVILKINAEENAIMTKKEMPPKVDFLVCQSCFWCASCIFSHTYKGITEQAIVKCPSCVKGDIESLPIAQNESYRFHYDTKRGVTVEFF